MPAATFSDRRQALSGAGQDKRFTDPQLYLFGPPPLHAHCKAALGGCGILQLSVTPIRRITLKSNAFLP